MNGCGRRPRLATCLLFTAAFLQTTIAKIVLAGVVNFVWRGLLKNGRVPC